jgi:hypothetical protein
MAKRALQIIGPATGVHDSDQVFASADGVRLAIALALWDGRGSRQPLRDIDRQARAVLGHWPSGDNAKEELQSQLAGLTALRIRAGDSQALADYESWIGKVERPAFGRQALGYLWPLCDSPNATANLARRRIFSGPPSPLDPRTALADARGSQPDYAAQLVGSPLVNQAAFRECLLAMLADTRAIGKVWTDGNGQMSYRTGRGSGGIGMARGHDADDRAMPPAGTKRPYRVCDVVATALQQYNGVPQYRPYWSDATRDAEIKRLSAFVKERGASLASRRPDHAMNWDPPFDWAWLW